VWAERVLQFLQIRQLFGQALFTGDPDIRKPSPEAFQQLADHWQLEPSQIVAIGDQEKTDILPAKTLGMLTVRIANQVESEADFQAPNVLAALEILKQEGIL
jgi:putative hydrolase of the HAD superfamily